MAGLVMAWLANRVSRRLLGLFCQPTLFFDSRTPPPFLHLSEFSGGAVALNRQNVRSALLASASIPHVMAGVRMIGGAPAGTYRDGGLYHYHPAFDFLAGQDGMVLYPHFYHEVTLGWLDKGRASRQASGDLLADVLLLAPSPQFVATLPNGRIPDRRDFVRMAGDDDERVRCWQQAVTMGAKLGEAFLQAVESGRIRELVQRLP